MPRPSARRSGPRRAGPSARSASARWLNGSPSLRLRSRCADPKRSPWVAFRNRSAHAAHVPRTAAFDGFRTSPSFHRVARRGLSLRRPLSLPWVACRANLRSRCRDLSTGSFGKTRARSFHIPLAAVERSRQRKMWASVQKSSSLRFLSNRHLAVVRPTGFLGTAPLALPEKGRPT